MRFKRFLAIILLLILPLQSTLAAIDSCCNRASDQQVVDLDGAIEQTEQASGSAGGDDANCCSVCDFCNHASASFDATPVNLHGKVLTAPPVPHPDFPIDSFIPEVPSRPDRA
jgi:hypothetical protein